MSNFILHSPPGEFNEVFNGMLSSSQEVSVPNKLSLALMFVCVDVRIILDNDRLLKSGAAE